jgi:hypothetical protein
MTIIRYFKEWRPKLEGIKYPIEVLSNHCNLEYFMTKKLLNCHQARWSKFLPHFNLKITFRLGRAGANPDTLMRQPKDLLESNDKRIIEMRKAVLKPENLPENLYMQDTESQRMTPLESLFAEAYKKDKILIEIIRELENGKQYLKGISLALCDIDNR